MIRLSECERRAVAHALHGIDFPVEVFGSRLNDTARGGDIDLLIFAPGMTAAERFRLSLHVAVRFRTICDAKIDVHVLDPEHLAAPEQAFLATVRSEPLCLTGLDESGMGNAPHSQSFPKGLFPIHPE